jgi:hypothetical protein
MLYYIVFYGSFTLPGMFIGLFSEEEFDVYMDQDENTWWENEWHPGSNPTYKYKEGYFEEKVFKVVIATKLDSLVL